MKRYGILIIEDDEVQYHNLKNALDSCFEHKKEFHVEIYNARTGRYSRKIAEGSQLDLIVVDLALKIDNFPSIPAIMGEDLINSFYNRYKNSGYKPHILVYSRLPKETMRDIFGDMAIEHYHKETLNSEGMAKIIAEKIIERFEFEENYNISDNAPKYDVFVSHADSDKELYVDNLVEAIKLLGVNCFYDKYTINWGDDISERIYNGIKESSFSILVISENYFGRQWTEQELTSFWKKQEALNEKIVLPLLLDISVEEYLNTYPQLKNIKAISAKDYSSEQIALMYAKELIKKIRI